MPRNIRALVLASLLTTIFAEPALAQRVIPAGENAALDGTYCNILAVPGTVASFTPSGALPCALYVKSGSMMQTGGVWAPMQSSQNNPTGAASTLSVQSNMGSQLTMNITASAVIKASAGRLFKVSVITPGVAGAIHNVTTTGGATLANQVAVIPAAVGVYEFNFAMSAGITYILGAGQQIVVSWE